MLQTPRGSLFEQTVSGVIQLFLHPVMVNLEPEFSWIPSRRTYILGIGRPHKTLRRCWWSLSSEGFFRWMKRMKRSSLEIWGLSLESRPKNDVAIDLCQPGFLRKKKTWHDKLQFPLEFRMLKHNDFCKQWTFNATEKTKILHDAPHLPFARHPNTQLPNCNTFGHHFHEAHLKSPRVETIEDWRIVLGIRPRNLSEVPLHLERFMTLLEISALLKW